MSPETSALLDRYRPLLYASHLHLAPDIPSELAESSREFYARQAEVKDILLLIDESTRHDGGEGLLVTSTAIYCRNAEDEPWTLPFSQVRAITCKEGVLGSPILFNDVKEYAPVRSGFLGRVLTWFLRELTETGVESIPKKLPVPLGPGESLGKGTCPKCGPVEVRVIPELYWPDRALLHVHIIASICTLGVWFVIICLRVFFSQILGGEKRMCLSCARELPTTGKG